MRLANEALKPNVAVKLIATERTLSVRRVLFEPPWWGAYHAEQQESTPNCSNAEPRPDQEDAAKSASLETEDCHT